MSQVDDDYDEWDDDLDDDDEDDDEAPFTSSSSLVLTAFITFVLAELGDKSQIATLLMAAKYREFVQVMSGATLGEMIAIAPAVLLGKTTAQWIPMLWVRIAAALLFAALSAWIAIVGLD